MRTGLFRTTSFQLTLLYVALSAISLAALLGVLYSFSIGYLERQTTATIESEISGLAEHYRRYGLNGLARVIRERIGNDRMHRSYYLFTDENLQPLAGNLAAWPDPRPTGDGWLQFDAQGAIVRARLFPLRGGLRLLVGRDVHELATLKSQLRRALFAGIGLTLALSMAGGLLMSASVLRRVDAINRTARRITEGELSLRLPSRGTGDELDELTDHLNDMLARMQTLVASVRHVGDNIAHDLRTPLTRLRNRLENLRTAPEVGLRDGVELLVEDADRLLATFQALLRISRLHSGAYAVPMVAVDLSQLVTDAAELYQAVAEAQGIALTASVLAGCCAHGDRDLLFQALANLLDNAIKYTPAGGCVQVTLERRESAAAFDVTVVDTGPGIPATERERVLEPFYRLDAGRAQPGSGLGLALVRAVADYHHAQLLLDDASPGLKATLRLPAAQVHRDA